MELPVGLADSLLRASESDGLILVLSGAGISAESGIPTFRGKEGYWTVGSRDYHPQEMATQAAFKRMPEEVWRWYLFRLGICRGAQPNPGHEAVAAIEKHFNDRFVLITQNTDGLHLRAGNSRDRTYEIHGNIGYKRCAIGCSDRVEALPPLPVRAENTPVSDLEQEAMRCRDCNDWARPHVLWFDETYDEDHYRFESSLLAAGHAAVLLVVGTSGATNLPNQVASLAARRGALVIDINPEDNPFGDIARYSLRDLAGTALPPIAAAMGL